MLLELIENKSDKQLTGEWHVICLANKSGGDKMFRKVSRERAKDREKEFLLERKAAACLETCLMMCTSPGGDSYGDEKDEMCEAP